MGIIGSYVIIRSDVFLYWQQRERVKDGGGDFHPFHFLQETLWSTMPRIEANNVKKALLNFFKANRYPAWECKFDVIVGVQ